MLNNRVSFWLLPLFLSWSSLLPVRAEIELLTTVRDIYIRDVCARAGSITFSVNGDDFANASPDNPVYIRLRLDHGSVSCRDIVNPSKNLDPILLPMRVEFPEYRIEADPTAVQIVRWFEGEPEIWLKVVESSTRWMSRNGDRLPPQQFVPVIFELGLDVPTYTANFQTAFGAGRANLPFPTRALNRADIAASPPVGALIEVDLTNSNLEAVEVNPAIEDSALNFDPIAFDDQTTGVETATHFFDITLGQLQPIAFSDDRIIGRGTLNSGSGSVPAFRWNTTIRDFHYIGSCERAGDGWGIILNDSFPDASPENPKYIKMLLNRGARLCETKVGPGGDPIYISLFLEEFDTVAPTLNIPNNAFSIVRWVEGENAVWLKLTASTSTWVRNGSELQPPSVDHPVQFFLFGEAQTAFDTTRDFFVTNRASLPFNTRNLGTDGAREDVADTRFFFDASQATFEPLPAPEDESALFVYPSAFDSTTQNVETAESAIDIVDGLDLNLSTTPLLLARAATLFPDSNDVVRLNTTISQVFEDGTCERTGQMRFQISGDVFPQASQEEPQYLRLRLSGGAVLCETRVGITAEKGQPISVALRLINNASLMVEMAAPRDALQIVRWKAGENEIWLKVTTPTSRWIRMRNSTSAPNTRDVVEFVLADSALDSFTRNRDDFNEGRANLAGNTTNTATSGAFGEVVDTYLGMDLTSFVLPTPSFIEFNADSFDHQTSGVETVEAQNQIQLGDLVPLQLTGDLQIAQTQSELPLRIEPEISVQGLEVITLDALLPDGIVPVGIRWENLTTGAVLSQDFSLAYDPLPGRTVRMRVLVTDNLGRVGEAFAVILVNPEGLDLNGDGKNTVDDLHQVTDQWAPRSKSVLDLLHIRIDEEK